MMATNGSHGTLLTGAGSSSKWTAPSAAPTAAEVAHAVRVLDRDHQHGGDTFYRLMRKALVDHVNCQWCSVDVDAEDQGWSVCGTDYELADYMREATLAQIDEVPDEEADFDGLPEPFPGAVFGEIKMYNEDRAFGLIEADSQEWSSLGDIFFHMSHLGVWMHVAACQGMPPCEGLRVCFYPWYNEEKDRVEARNIILEGDA